jgi:hypothetical protein
VNVIHLAFPNIHMLTRSYTSSVERIETPDLFGVASYAIEAGLSDSTWRRTKGPETFASSTDWFRGNLGAIACAVATEDAVNLHVFSRDGTPLVIRRMSAAWTTDQDVTG